MNQKTAFIRRGLADMLTRDSTKSYQNSKRPPGPIILESASIPPESLYPVYSLYLNPALISPIDVGSAFESVLSVQRFLLQGRSHFKSGRKRIRGCVVELHVDVECIARWST